MIDRPRTGGLRPGHDLISLARRTRRPRRAGRERRGATFLKGQGAYTGKEKDILLTVANTFQIKRVEEIVFGQDPDAFMITENTFNVLGKGFSQRKIY